MKLNEIGGQSAFQTKEGATAWLNAVHFRKNFDIDFSDGKVNLTKPDSTSFFLDQRDYPSSHRMYELPVKFGIVSNKFCIYGTSIRNLKGFPDRVGDRVDLEDMGMLESIHGIEGCKIKNSLVIKNCGIAGTGISLEGIHEIEFYSGAGIIDIDRSKIVRGGVGMVLIPGLKKIFGYSHDKSMIKPFSIIEKYLGRPHDIYECQAELIDAGLDEYAVL